MTEWIAAGALIVSLVSFGYAMRAQRRSALADLENLRRQLLVELLAIEIRLEHHSDVIKQFHERCQTLLGENTVPTLEYKIVSLQTTGLFNRAKEKIKKIRQPEISRADVEKELTSALEMRIRLEKFEKAVQRLEDILEEHKEL